MKSAHFPLFAVLSLVLTLQNARADESQPESPAGRILASTAYLDGHAGFSVQMDMVLSLLKKDGSDDGLTLQATLDYAGEDRARFRVVTPEDTLELFVSDESTVLYLAKENKYLDGTMFGPRNKALTAMPAGPFRGAQMLLSDILHGAPGFLEALKSSTAEYRDTDALDGSEQIHLKNPQLDVDFWIQQKGEPVLRRFSLDLTDLATRGNPELKSATLAYTFNDWNLEPAFAEGHFAFEKPDGATEYSPPRPKDPMVGMPAPNISAPLLTEGTLDLASHKGKDVVILDFWATWCGPCRIGLPIVERVAERYEDKGVVLFAVNSGEDKPTIQAFVEQMGLAATVVMDTNRTASRDYRASSIPRTVVVGRDGFIRDVYAGVTPGMEKELDALLAELTE
jgi:thiol-disulfide isomerase/thioredoxin